MLIVDYTFGDDSLLYASYSRGTKPAGINPPINPSQSVARWEKLVTDIGMVKLSVEGNPICGYVDTPGNAGLTIAGIIEKSHISEEIRNSFPKSFVIED